MKRLFGCLVPALVILTFSHACAQSLDNQERCSIQAKKEYDQWKADYNSELAKFQMKDSEVSGQYQSHFNTKIAKCLMLLTVHHSDLSREVILEDAFELRVYADYTWVPSATKKYWEVPPVICELIPNTRDKKSCSKTDEFDAFVANYLEE